MCQDVDSFVAACVVCQQHKSSTPSPAGLLHPIPIPNRVWEDISMDFVEGLPKSGEFDSILVVVGHLTSMHTSWASIILFRLRLWLLFSSER